MIMFSVLTLAITSNTKIIVDKSTLVILYSYETALPLPSPCVVEGKVDIVLTRLLCSGKKGGGKFEKQTRLYSIVAHKW